MKRRKPRSCFRGFLFYLQICSSSIEQRGWWRPQLGSSHGLRNMAAPMNTMKYMPNKIREILFWFSGLPLPCRNIPRPCQRISPPKSNHMKKSSAMPIKHRAPMKVNTIVGIVLIGFNVPLLYIHTLLAISPKTQNAIARP